MAVIEIIERNCKDCYKCVRACPVKAIRISGGHAHIDETRCLADGRCITVCPQKAKSGRSDLAAARELLRGTEPVFASLAPSWTADFDEKPEQMAAALKLLGFAGVEETAVGALLVTEAYAKLRADKGGPLLASACPAVTNLLEKYHPAALPWYAPVLSPMQAHATLLRESHGPGTRVVFFGPCVAKKSEVDGNPVGGADLALTFRELSDWLNMESIIPSKLEGEKAPAAKLPTRAFPLEGGMYNGQEDGSRRLDGRNITITGLENCMDFLPFFLEEPGRFDLVELMACPEGCISGPAFNRQLSTEARRQKVLFPAGEGLPAESLQARERISLERSYEDKSVDSPVPNEEEITALLASIGKTSPEDELNCGACGYNSCREKAVAVYQGMAEIEMCMPYMRRKAETMSTQILEFSPNGILVVDRELRIMSINPAFGRMFDVSEESVHGQPLAGLMDEEPFRKAMDRERCSRRRVTFPGRDLVARMEVYSLTAQKALVAILIDITQEEKRRDEQGEVRRETLKRAKEVIDKQMRVAHEIAGLLGETTAESKILLTKIMELVQKKDDDK